MNRINVIKIINNENPYYKAIFYNQNKEIEKNLIIKDFDELTDFLDKNCDLYDIRMNFDYYSENKK